MASRTAKNINEDGAIDQNNCDLHYIDLHYIA